jgi:hypothetical protein
MIRFFRIFLLLVTCVVHSQSFFVKSGKNYTKINYGNTSTSSIYLHPDIGNTYQFGIYVPIENTRYHYEVGFQLDEYNSYVEAPLAAANYNLNYLGINNSLLYSIIQSGREGRRFSLNAGGGITLSKYVSGKEFVKDKIYDLKSFPEFKNFFLTASLEIQAKLVVFENVDFSIGYDRCVTMLNTGNGNNQSLSFSSNQIKVGVYFLFN